MMVVLSWKWYFIKYSILHNVFTLYFMKAILDLFSKIAVLLPLAEIQYFGANLIDFPGLKLYEQRRNQIRLINLVKQKL